MLQCTSDRSKELELATQELRYYVVSCLNRGPQFHRKLTDPHLGTKHTCGKVE